MADNLIFPIGFDLEKGVRDAQGQMDSVLRRLQKTVDGKPLTVPMNLDPSKFTTFESALRGSIQHITDDAQSLKAALDSSLQTDNSANINRITEAMRSLEAAWKALPNNQKFDINDRLTPKAQEMVRQFNELATASSTYGQTLSQIAGKIKRVADEEARANQKRNDGYAKLRKTLGAQENSIANLSAKIKAYQQILNNKEIGSRSFERVAEKIRKLSEKLEAARAKIKALTQTAVSSNAKHAQSVNYVTQEYQKQDGYVSRLLKRLAVYASFSYAGQFLTSIREVTAQFELQRISLGAIIQDQHKANALFSEIKSFALKSPVSIMDLTKYTKQLAAYKVGWDGVKTDTKELFGWTKKLTDVSVGLGVSMDRVVLAFGQVRATGYLRASEVRQFTEMGVPIVEELAAKLTDMNGKLVTSADVMEMISKRAISFDMVKDVFDDMTSAGGMFYNMQEKQGNTLYGLWAKLGDAASIMYDEIGNTDSVNSAMKDSIQFLTDLMKNWRLVGREMVVAAGTFLLLRANTVLSAQGTALAAKATNDYAAATTRLNAAQKRGAQTAAYAASLSKKAAVLNRAASISTNAWTAATLRLQAAMYSLKAAFIGNWITLAIAVVAAISAALYSAYEKAHKLQNELKEISAAGQAESAKSVFNFERLANAALEAATGSREQKEALDELKRSYGDMIPVEQLSLENLQKLRAQGYEPLTAAIKEYIAQRTLQKGIDAITSHYTEDTIAKQRQLRELFKRGSIYSFFKGVAWSPIEGLDDDQISQVFANVDKIAKDKSKSWEDVWVEAIKSVTDVSEDAEKKMRKMFVNETQNAQQQSYNNKMRDIVENTRNMADETDTATKKMELQTGSLGKYKQTLDETSKSLANLRLVWSNDKEVDPSSFLGKQMVSNASIKAWKEDIIENLQDAGIAIKNEWFNIITNLNSKDPSKISSINFAPILDAVDSAKDKLGDKFVPLKSSILKYQELYNGIVPSDRTVSAMRSRLMQIASNIDKTGSIMNDLQRHLMKSSDNWENYSKSVRDAVKDYEAQIDEMKKINASIKKGEKGVGPLDPSKYSDEEIKKVQLLVEALKQLFPLLAPEKSSGGGRTSDPRLQNLKEEISLVQKLYNEYKQLEKQEGATKAAADMRRMAGDTLDMFKSKYNIDLPTDAKDLTAALEILYKKMAALPKKAFPSLDKDLKELRWTIEKVDIDESQKNIEAELKRLADRISRTKTAKEFYEKILGMTGDYELAANIAVQLYGSNGKELGEQIKEQFRLAFAKLDKPDAKVPAKIGDLIDKGRFEELRDYIELLPESQRKAAEDLVKAQQQMSVKQYEQWLKDLEKAKDYADKRIELSRYTANQIAAIEERIAKLNPQAADYEQQKAILEKLIDGYKSRENKMSSELEYEQFKNSALYVQVFENLDNASKTALENMRSRLLALKDQWKNLSPEKVKELTKRLEELDAQIAGRNPFKSIADSIKKLREMRMSGRTKEGDAQIAFDAEADRQAAEAKMLADEKAYEAAVKQYGAESDITKAKRKIADDSADAYRNAEKAADSAAENADEWKNVEEAINSANQKIDEYQQQINEALSGVRKIMESFGASSEDMQFFDDVTNGFNEIFDAGQQGAEAYASFMMGDFVGAATKGISAVGSLISGVTNLFYAGRVKRANKEIKRQQELLEQLEYTYGRLEKAADKLFGRDYVNNYNQQLKNLQAQQQAYLKQAQAERSKGKKEDKEKTKEFEEQARETADKIKEMQDELVAHFTGSSKTDIARQMAKSWIDAKASMSDTFAAIKGDYQDMIKNMIVEGAAARVIENALSPVWDSMQKMLEKNDVQGAIDSLVNGMDSALNAANNGMEVLWKALEARGYDMKKMLGTSDTEMTGIAKSVAGATSEEINNVAAIGNTLMYYVSPIPRIDENLARVVAIMEGRGAALPMASGVTTGAVDYTEMFTTANQHLSSLPRMEQHLAEIHTMLGRALRTKGSTTGFNTFLNS